MITQAGLAVHLDMSLVRLRVLVSEKVIPWPCATLDDGRVPYIRHLRARKGGVTDERSRLDAARAELAELDLRLKSGEAVPATDNDVGYIALSTVTAARVLAVPAKVASEVAAETDPHGCQAIVERECHAALRDLVEAGARAKARAAEDEDRRRVSARGNGAAPAAQRPRVGRAEADSAAGVA